MSGRLFTPESAVTVHPEVMRLEKELARTRRELAGAKKLCDHLARLIREVEEHAEQESPSGHEQ
jgi:hypothetical protein